MFRRAASRLKVLNPALPRATAQASNKPPLMSASRICPGCRHGGLTPRPRHDLVLGCVLWVNFLSNPTRGPSSLSTSVRVPTDCSVEAPSADEAYSDERRRISQPAAAPGLVQPVHGRPQCLHPIACICRSILGPDPKASLKGLRRQSRVCRILLQVFVSAHAAIEPSHGLCQPRCYIHHSRSCLQCGEMVSARNLEAIF